MSRSLDVDAAVSPLEGQLAPGFLTDYVRWAAGQTDAPAQYHVVVALALLSAVMNSRAFCGFGTAVMPPNLFVMVVGGSGMERKTASMSLGRKLLVEAAPERIETRIGSYEALVDQIAENPCQIIFEPEFSRFLHQSGTGNHLQAVKLGLTDLYDGEKVSSRTRSHGKVATAENYRLSLVGAISDSYLQQFTEPSDFTGGFLSRWLFSIGERNQFLYQPPYSAGVQERRDRLINHLKMLHSSAPQGIYRVMPNTEADDLFYDWSTALDAHARHAEHKLQGMYTRAQPLTLRIAGLLAMNRIAAEGVRVDPLSMPADNQFPIGLEDLLPATHIVAAHLRSCQRIVALVSHNPVDRLKARVLAALPEPAETGGLRFVSLGQITRGAGLMAREAKTVLETLRLENQVTCLMGPGNALLYARTEQPKTLAESNSAVASLIPAAPTEHQVTGIPERSATRPEGSAPQEPLSDFAPYVPDTAGVRWDD